MALWRVFATKVSLGVGVEKSYDLLPDIVEKLKNSMVIHCKSKAENKEITAATARSPIGRIAVRLLFATKVFKGGGVLAEGSRQRATKDRRDPTPASQKPAFWGAPVIADIARHRRDRKSYQRQGEGKTLKGHEGTRSVLTVLE
jgi:hypothetical protein